MNLKTKLGLIVFLIVLFEHASFISIGLENSLSDLHGFRQTQTALTAFYFAKNGFQPDYLTPVLGYPWSIPFEFPTYQWFVAQFHWFFNVELGMAGRCISILFFYSSILALFVLLKNLAYSNAERLILISVVMFNPVLLFWSRTFMIESTAVLFSTLYFLFLFKVLHDYKASNRLNFIWLIMASAFGVVAALTKITTFSNYMICGLLFFTTLLYSEWKRKRWRLISGSIVISTFCFFIPVVLASIWTIHTDAVKELSYLGGFLTSASLKNWNFGSLAQKISINTWFIIDDHTTHYLVASFTFTLASFILKLKHRWHMLAFSCSALSGPLLFTNLYQIHDYYSFANATFLSLAIGLFTLSIWGVRHRMVVFVPGAICVITILWYSCSVYVERYYSYQLNNYSSLQLIGNAIGKITTDKDVLLVTGNDWSSEIPYYSERKSVCIPMWSMGELSTNTSDFLRKLSSSHITAFVTFSPSGIISADGLEMRIVKHFELSETPTAVGGNVLLFLRKTDQKNLSLPH